MPEVDGLAAPGGGKRGAAGRGRHYAYIPGYWRAAPEGSEADGVPTSYYSAVQFVCRPTVIDEPEGKAALLTAQLADLQPEGRHAVVAVDEAPYGRMLPGIRGVLEERGRGLDAGAAERQQRRLDALGDWKSSDDWRGSDD